MTMITSVIRLISACGIAWILTNISVEDSRICKIRNKKVIWVLMYGILYRLSSQINWIVNRTYNGWMDMLDPIIQGLLGMVIVALPMLILACYFKVPIGGGDIKLTGALGLFVGWKGSLWILLISCVSACFEAGIRALGGKEKVSLKTRIPMAVHMQIGYTVVIICSLLIPGF